jgi:uncharacterized membrane protein YagU involved in acid resistance
MNSHQLLRSSAAGGLAGLVATIPMTLAMQAMFRALPRRHQYPLPPRQIFTRLARSVGAHRKLNDDHRRQLSRAAHFGFGTAAGMTYGAVGQRALPGVLGGMLFGLGVWAVSYQGWLPAANVLPPATRTPRHRNALMIAAHLVWGASAALVLARCDSKASGSSDR